jgi:hypothetical protein
MTRPRPARRTCVPVIGSSGRARGLDRIKIDNVQLEPPPYIAVVLLATVALALLLLLVTG